MIIDMDACNPGSVHDGSRTEQLPEYIIPSLDTSCYDMELD
jgi:hypothetical protein